MQTDGTSSEQNYRRLLSESTILGTSEFEDTRREVLVYTKDNRLAILSSGHYGPEEGASWYRIDYVDMEEALNSDKHDFYLLTEEEVDRFPDEIRGEWKKKAGFLWFPRL